MKTHHYCILSYLWTHHFAAATPIKDPNTMGLVKSVFLATGL